MKTVKAIELAGGRRALAELLAPITQSAITQWGDSVPEARVWQLKALRPEWFADEARRAGPDRRKASKAA